MRWIVDMHRALRYRRVMAWAALLTFSAALGGCINTTTYGTGESPEVSVVKGATKGLSGFGGKKEKIDYSPRAPLVMPPESNLRQPVASAAEADPDWPGQSQVAKVEDPLGPTSRDNKEYRDSLQPIRSTENKQSAGYDPEKDIARANVDYIRQREARKKFKKALDDADVYNNREGRRYLTDPPEAYREPAESAPKEFDDIKEAEGSGFRKWFSWMNRPKE